MTEITVTNARLFALAAHSATDQRRKYTGRPYIEHPQAVATLVESVADGDSNMVAAAWLHDVVEDTAVTVELIEREFGSDVARLVEGLTDVSTRQDGNRAARKEIDRNHIAQQCPRTKTIKLADLIHNSASIFKYDPKFAAIYMQEKQLLLEVLTEGNQKLYELAETIVDRYFQRKQA